MDRLCCGHVLINCKIQCYGALTIVARLLTRCFSLEENHFERQVALLRRITWARGPSHGHNGGPCEGRRPAAVGVRIFGGFTESDFRLGCLSVETWDTFRLPLCEEPGVILIGSFGI